MTEPTSRTDPADIKQPETMPRIDPNPELGRLVHQRREAERERRRELADLDPEAEARAAGDTLAAAEAAYLTAAHTAEQAKQQWADALAARVRAHQLQTLGPLAADRPRNPRQYLERIGNRGDLETRATTAARHVDAVNEALAQAGCEPHADGPGGALHNRHENVWRIRVHKNGKVLDEPESVAAPKVHRHRTAEFVEVVAPDRDWLARRAAEAAKAL